MEKRISIAIADNHPLCLQGLVSVLKQEFSIIGTAPDGQELLDLLKIKQPDVVLIDLNMPSLDGLSTCRQVSKQYPCIKSIIISFYYDEQLDLKFKFAGIKGYLTKDISGDILIRQIKHVAAGGTAFPIPPKQIKSHIHGAVTFQDCFVQQYNLSARELEIISLIRKGLTSNEISESLFISINTVEAHRKHIFQKLKIRNVQSLVEFANHHSL